MSFLERDLVSDIHVYGLDIKNREIYLNSVLCGDDNNPGVDYRMASIFLKNMKILESQSRDPILIRMHSVGGSWQDGMVIYDCISLSRCRVDIVAYGQAESMSSVILQSAKKRMIYPNAHVMIHYGQLDITGDHLSAQSYAKLDKDNTEKMIDIYTSRCIDGPFFKKSNPSRDIVKTKNFLKRKLKDGDWYMTADEAVYYGFADAVYGK